MSRVACRVGLLCCVFFLMLGHLCVLTTHVIVFSKRNIENFVSNIKQFNQTVFLKVHNIA